MLTLEILNIFYLLSRLELFIVEYLTVKKLAFLLKVCYYGIITNKGGITMYLAKFTLIALVTFAFLTGCAMVNKQAEMPIETAEVADEAMDAIKVPTPEKSVYQEVTFQVEGMT